MKMIIHKIRYFKANKRIKKMKTKKITQFIDSFSTRKQCPKVDKLMKPYPVIFPFATGLINHPNAYLIFHHSKYICFGKEITK